MPKKKAIKINKVFEEDGIGVYASGTAKHGQVFKLASNVAAGPHAARRVAAALSNYKGSKDDLIKDLRAFAESHDL